MEKNPSSCKIGRKDENPNNGAEYKQFQIIAVINTHPSLDRIASQVGAPQFQKHLPVL